ncbi:hypothetical protein ACX80U_01020 [Arthrobacter sp. TmT3-37]
MNYSMVEWIAAFRASFDHISALPRDEWNLVAVCPLDDETLAVVVDQGPHRFGRRFRLESLNNSGFRGLRHPGELAAILILGEVLEPHSLDSRPSSLVAEGIYPKAIWGGEQPENDDDAATD